MSKIRIDSAIVKATKLVNTPTNNLSEDKVLIVLANGMETYRSMKQITRDLFESGRKHTSSVYSINDPMLTRTLLKLRGGSYSADHEFWKQGDSYELTATSRQLTDPKHDDYGKGLTIGTTVEHPADGNRIDGFISLDVADKWNVIEENAIVQVEYAQRVHESIDLGALTDNIVPQEDAPAPIVDTAPDAPKAPKPKTSTAKK